MKIPKTTTAIKLAFHSFFLFFIFYFLNRGITDKTERKLGKHGKRNKIVTLNIISSR